MSSVDSRFYGVASGILGTMRQVGGMFSMGMTMVIFSLFIGKVQITPAYYPVFLKSTKVAFAFFRGSQFLEAYLRPLAGAKSDEVFP
jgi:hypothetical protein